MAVYDNLQKLKGFNPHKKPISPWYGLNPTALKTISMKQVNEYAERVKQHPDTIRRKCNKGTIEAIKFPGSTEWRIPIGNTT